jgi:hypothetical protein
MARFGFSKVDPEALEKLFEQGCQYIDHGSIIDINFNEQTRVFKKGPDNYLYLINKELVVESLNGRLFVPDGAIGNRDFLLNLPPYIELPLI